MTKRIKAIKCPQCGSTKATELRTDFYKCKSCHTEYFIDSDDIVIHHKHEHAAHNGNIGEKQSPKVLLISVCIATALMSVVIFSTGSHSSISDLNIFQGLGMADTFWESVHNFQGFADAKGEARILVIGSKVPTGVYAASGKLRPHIGIYRADDKTKIAVRPIEGFDDEEVSRVSMNSFSNGDVYIILNKKRLFKLNLTTYELEELVFEKQNLKELATGIYEVRFSLHGDGFCVTNNLGQEYNYYPMINQIYPYKDIYAISKQTPPDATKRLGFQFSEASVLFPEEELQLLKYYYWYQPGYPCIKPRFQWNWEYNSGISSGVSRRKTLIGNGSIKDSRMISYKNFTPDRHYASGNVLAWDDKQVLISFSNNLSKNPIVQLLDANTAEVIWTVTTDMCNPQEKQVIPVKDGYLFTSYLESWLYNTRNKTSQYIQWNF